MKPAIGMVVRDVITGFTGTASQQMEYLNGNIQLAIYPQAVDNKYPEAMFIDLASLEVIEDCTSLSVVTPVQCTVKLGDRVRCNVTGFEGIATTKATYINGCVSFGVEPKVDAKKGAMQPTEYISSIRLERIEAEAFSAPETNTGGPAVRASGMRAR